MDAIATDYCDNVATRAIPINFDDTCPTLNITINEQDPALNPKHWFPEKPEVPSYLTGNLSTDNSEDGPTENYWENLIPKGSYLENLLNRTATRRTNAKQPTKETKAPTKLHTKEPTKHTIKKPTKAPKAHHTPEPTKANNNGEPTKVHTHKPTKVHTDKPIKEHAKKTEKPTKEPKHEDEVERPDDVDGDDYDDDDIEPSTYILTNVNVSVGQNCTEVPPVVTMTLYVQKNLKLKKLGKDLDDLEKEFIEKVRV